MQRGKVSDFRFITLTGGQGEGHSGRDKQSLGDCSGLKGQAKTGVSATIITDRLLAHSLESFLLIVRIK